MIRYEKAGFFNIKCKICGEMLKPEDNVILDTVKSDIIQFDIPLHEACVKSHARERLKEIFRAYDHGVSNAPWDDHGVSNAPWDKIQLLSYKEIQDILKELIHDQKQKEAQDRLAQLWAKKAKI